MASISRLLFFRHLRAEPNQFILHYRDGKPVRRGAGIAYWFNPLSAAVAQVPVEDCETTFVLKERSLDFQEVTVQCTVTYRFTDPERAAARVNFTISLLKGTWTEQPLERLANLWSQKAQQPARTFIANSRLVEALRNGADQIRVAIESVLRADPEIATMGVTLVNVLVSHISPTAELEKALQTPTREEMQQKADEAVFARRALAVEKERAIKENELATQIELARREDQLIRQKGANRLLEVQTTAEAERQRVEADWQRDRIAADVTGLALIKQFDKWEGVSKIGVWEQRQIRHAKELGIGVQGPDAVRIVPSLLGGSRKEFDLLVNQLNQEVGPHTT